MLRSSVHRADLLVALRALGQGMPSEVAARLCGFEFMPPEPTAPVRALMDEPPTVSDENRSAPPSLQAPERPKFRFWRAESLEQLAPEEVKRLHEPPPEIANATWMSPRELMYVPEAIPGKPLVDWPRLWPFLREVLGRRRWGREPDLARVVRWMAQGRPLIRLPRRPRRAWSSRVLVLLDRREELVPFWDDYENLLRRLVRMRGEAGLRVLQVKRDDRDRPPVSPTGFRGSRYPRKSDDQALNFPSSETSILVLGDLNQYRAGPALDCWLSFGRKLRRRGIVPWALCPCPRSRWSPSMARAWNMACWDRGQRLPQQGDGLTAQPLSREALAARQQAQFGSLLPLLAPAVRVERGLLRDLRLLLPGSEADSGVEYDLFQAPETMSGEAGISLKPELLPALRAEFSFLDPHRLARVVATLRRHHASVQEVFGHMEVQGMHEVLPAHHWDQLIQLGILPADALERAREFWRRLAKTLAAGRPGFEGTAAFAGRDWMRLQNLARSNPEMQAIWAMAHPAPDRVLPESVQPEVIAWLQKPLQEESVFPVSMSEGLCLGSAEEGDVPLARLRSSCTTCFLHLQSGTVPNRSETRELDWTVDHRIPAEELASVQQVTLQTGLETLRLAPVERPYWATRIGYDRDGLFAEWGDARERQALRWTLLAAAPGYGTRKGSWVPQSWPGWAKRLWADDYGVAAEFVVGGVSFVLRWIPPGRFFMGSPEDEPGRFESEGPQYEVTLTQGFWLGEAPVTQAQWRAVVNAERKHRPFWRSLFQKKEGELNPTPSHFQGPAELPVESVSYTDCEAFCRMLDGLIPGGPGFGAPTEAQWEFACRAGTSSALYTGGITILGENHAPELDGIAWYGGNSGEDLEVINPSDSSAWPNQHYAHHQAGTHRVKLKKPNAWGLYDLLGNVWEWCQDGWSAYRPPAGTDPVVASGDSSGARVVRGGSWANSARTCRAAYRRLGDPGSRFENQGFRLAAGQGAAGGGAAGRGAPPGAGGLS